MAEQVLRGRAVLWQVAAAALFAFTFVLVPGSAAASDRTLSATAPSWVRDVRSVLDLPRSLKPGEHAWQDSEPAAGPLRIFIDLETALVHVLRGRVEIGRAKIIFGSDNKPTPTGTFRILQKSENHVSNIYHVPMPYMLRLTWDGVAIHSTDVRGRTATHGCVGVPERFATRLFQEAGIGTEVVVTRVEISNEHLRMNGGLHGLLGLLSLRESIQ